MPTTTEPTRDPRRRTIRADLVWPVAIALALALVVAVNAAFIWIAVHGADEVAPSYVRGER